MERTPLNTGSETYSANQELANVLTSASTTSSSARRPQGLTLRQCPKGSCVTAFQLGSSPLPFLAIVPLTRVYQS